MSYLETVFVVLRRWRVSIPAFGLSICLAAATYAFSPARYEDSAQVLLLSSSQLPGQKYASNPYLGMSSTLVATADVLRLRAASPETVDRLAQRGATADYEVVLDTSTAAPVLLVTTRDDKAGTARTTLRAVIAELGSSLEALQARSGAPRATWLSTMTLTTLSEPKRLINDEVRPAVTVGAVSLALSLFVLFLSEGRRRRPQSRNPSPGPPGPAGPPSRPTTLKPSGNLLPQGRTSGLDTILLPTAPTDGRPARQP